MESGMDIETVMKLSLIKPRTHNVHEVEWVRVPGYERNGNVDRYVTVRGCGPSHPRDLRPNTPLTHLSLKARHSTYDSLVYLLT
jgi:hypothetical protein